MKYIFDFDDVLFSTKRKFKPLIFKVLSERTGATEEKLNDLYDANYKEGRFSLKKFIALTGVRGVDADILYNEILEQTPSFVNQEVLNEIKKLGKENCYIVTSGDKEFQMDKIRASGLEPYFKRITPVTGTKRDEIKKICNDHPGEQVFFVDDNKKNIDELHDTTEFPNLIAYHHNIKYSENETDDIKRLVEEIRKVSAPKEPAQEMRKMH